MMNHPFNRDRFTWLAYLLLAFFAYFINVLGPITPYLKDELNLSYTVGSLHYTAFAVGILCVGLAGHLVIERIGRWRALWLGALGVSLGVFLLIAGRSAVVTISATFLMGLVGSLILVIVPSALADLHGLHATQALTESNVMASLVAITAPLLVGWFAPLPGGWRVSLGLVALTPLLLRLWAGRKVQVPIADAPHQHNALSRAKLPGWFWVYWMALLLGVATEFCMLSWSADFLEKSLGMAQNAAVQAVSLFLAGMILGRLGGNLLLRRLSARAIVLLSTAVAGVGFLLFWQSGSVTLGLAGLLITGLGVASMYPMILSLAMEAAQGKTVQAAARATLASGIAILALPLTLGRLADAFGIQAAYSMVLVLLLGVSGAIVVTGRK